MLKLLNRTLISSFYQQHAGLFLVVFYLIFGAVEGSQIISYQKALLLAVSTSPILLLFVFGIWLLYGIKCIHFINRTLNQENYGFFNVLNTLAKKKQKQLGFYLYAMCFIPILVYSVLIIGMAISEGYYYSAIATPIFVLGVLNVATIYTYHKTNYTYNPPKAYIKLPFFKLPRPYWLWSLYHFLTDQKIALIVTKLVSFLVFKAVLWMFADIGNDVKVYLTAMFAVVLSHAVLLFNMVKFEATYLGFIVALPMNKLSSIKHQIVVLFILIIPELIIYSWIVGFELIFMLRALLFSVSALLFLKALVIFLKADMESYMKWLLFYFFISMLAILSSNDILFSCISVSLAFGYLILNRRDIKVLA